jgi:hypothetical protein
MQGFDGAQVCQILRGGERKFIIANTDGEMDEDKYGDQLLTGWFNTNKPRELSKGDVCILTLDSDEYDLIIDSCEGFQAKFTAIRRQYWGP